jgi:small-conductance mechanosensitive channel
MKLDLVIFLVISLMVWLIFGYISDTISCDIKRLLKNIYIKQIFVILSIFFLFIIVGDNKKKSALMIIKESFILYVIYLLLTKNKWWFFIPVISLAVFHQLLKLETEYLKNNTDEDKKTDKKLDEFKKIQLYLEYLIVFLIIIGFIHYLFKQYIDHKKNFNFIKFLFTPSCKE